MQTIRILSGVWLVGILIILLGSAVGAEQLSEARGPSTGEPQGKFLWQRPFLFSRWIIDFRRVERGGLHQHEADEIHQVRVCQYGRGLEGEYSQEIESWGGTIFQAWVSGRRLYQSQLGNDGISAQSLGLWGEFSRERTDFKRKSFAAERRGSSDLASAAGVENRFVRPFRLYQIEEGGSDALGGGCPNWASLKEFEWIRDELFQGTRLIAGEWMDIYVECDSLGRQRLAEGIRSGVQKGPLGVPVCEGVRAAGIEVHTGFPRILQEEMTLSSYEFSRISSQPMRLPEKVLRHKEAATRGILGGLLESVRPY